MRVLLVGNYGADNVGDDLLCEYFRTRFAGTDFVIPKARPKVGEWARLPMGVRSFVAGSWLRTMREFWHVDCVVFGGGTLFTDTESILACFLWAFHALMARIAGKPYHIAFQGFGPFRTWLGLTISVLVFRHAASVSVRDNASLTRLREACPRVPAILTTDPVLQLMLMLPKPAMTKTWLTIIPRPGGLGPLEQVLPGFLQQFPFVPVMVASMHAADPRDLQKVQAVASSLKVAGRTVETCVLHDGAELAAQILKSVFVLTERFHGAVAAAALDVPYQAVSQVPGDKLEQANTLDAAMAVRLIEAGEFVLPLSKTHDVLQSK